MKKILSLLMAIIMLSMCLGLVACGDGELNVLVNGESLEEYTVVIPKECDKITQYAAQNLIFLLKDTLGIELPLVTDDTAEVEKEILIGETNREASKTTVELKDGEYLLFTSGAKIVMKGYGIYVGGACGSFVNLHIRPLLTGKSKIKVNTLDNTATATEFQFAETYTSVIFMIGDGMGYNHIRMAERHMTDSFVGRYFPNMGWSVTASVSVLKGDIDYTDSAASATAMATGYKTYNRYVGMSPEGASLLNVRELAHSKGAKTAVITTDTVTGATPSGFLCHVQDRGSTEELQAQIDKIVAEGKIDYLKADIPHSTAVHLECVKNELKTALETISAGNGSFFIMAEEAYIDKYADDYEYMNTINSVKRLNDAAIYATEFVLCHPSTALIITADHETGGLIDDSSNPAMFSFTTHNHTNTKVPIFAIGPGTQIFNTTYDNTDLAKFIAKAYSTEAFGTSEEY